MISQHLLALAQWARQEHFKEKVLWGACGLVVFCLVLWGVWLRSRQSHQSQMPELWCRETKHAEEGCHSRYLHLACKGYEWNRGRQCTCWTGHSRGNTSLQGIRIQRIRSISFPPAIASAMCSNMKRFILLRNSLTAANSSPDRIPGFGRTSVSTLSNCWLRV